MYCKSLTVDNVAIWDEFVHDHPSAWVGHLSAIPKLESIMSGAVPRSLIVFNSKDKVVGVLPLYELVQRELRVIPVKKLTTGFLFPSGPLLDRQLSPKESKEVLGCIISQMKATGEKHHADRIIVTYPAVAGNHFCIDEYGYYPLRRYGFSEQNIVGMTLDLRKDETELFSGIKGNCRNMIRRAEKDGAEFEVIADRNRWLACYELNRQTLGDHAYTLKTMEALWEEVIAPGHGTVTAATCNSQLHSVVVSVGINNSVYYWMGFNAKPVTLTGANNFVLWQTILHWKNRGSTFFEMGSLEFSGEKMKSISSFKESFGGKPHYLLSGFMDIKKIKRKTIEVIEAFSTTLRNNTGTRG